MKHWVLLLGSASLVLLSIPSVAVFDDDRIVFVTNRFTNDEICVMNRDGSNVVRLTKNGGRDWFPAWAPDKRRIAWATDRDADFEVYAMDDDGTHVVNLTHHPKEDTLPCWWPDGKRILFCRRESPRDPFKLLSMNADGTDQRLLFEYPGHDTWFPAISPDGRRIVYVLKKEAYSQLWIMNSDGTGNRQLLRNEFRDSYPSWSPSGKQIAFQRIQNDTGAVFMVNDDGSNEEMLLGDIGGSTNPDFSPDGKQVVLCGLFQERFSIITYDLASKMFVDTSNHPSVNRTPRWRK